MQKYIFYEFGMFVSLVLFGYFIAKGNIVYVVFGITSMYFYGMVNYFILLNNLVPFWHKWALMVIPEAREYELRREK